MLEQNKQEVSDVNNAVVQQANGNINITNIGLGYNDVRAISQDVIAHYLSSFTTEALDIFKNRIAEFERLFIKKLENIDIPYAKEELKTPHMQNILHNTMGEYAKSENPNTREELLDLLIERLKVNDDNEKCLIEEAIKILPSITKNQGNFLASLFLLDKFHFILSPSRKRFVLSLLFFFIIIFLSSLIYFIIFAGRNNKEVYFSEYPLIGDPYVKLTTFSFVRNLFKYICDFLGEFLPFLLVIFIFLLPVFLFFRSLFNLSYRRKKCDSIYILLQNTEILHPYVLMEKNDNYDIDHLKQIHCCADDRKRNIFEKIDMAKEAYFIVFKRGKPIIPFSPYYFKRIKDIYDKQKVFSNIRLTPVGEYIGKRIFDKITKQQ